jgi:hypothetical protein
VNRSNYQRLTGLLCGFLGGLFGGLVGLGGGVIMIPLMTWLAKVTQHKAHGTSLIAVACTGAVGAVTYSFHGAVDWKVSLVLAASAIVTVRLGAIYAASLSERNLKRAFGVFLIVVSVSLLLKGYIPETGSQLGFLSRIAIFLTVGAVTGFVSGMMGVGGGGVMIPPMVILAGMSQHMAQGTSLLAMVPAGVSGAVSHYRLGNVEMHVAGGLIVGAVIGAYLGGTAANIMPEMYLKGIFSAVGIWMGIRYLRPRKSDA